QVHVERDARAIQHEGRTTVCGGAARVAVERGQGRRRRSRALYGGAALHADGARGDVEGDEGDVHVEGRRGARRKSRKLRGGNLELQVDAGLRVGRVLDAARGPGGAEGREEEESRPAEREEREGGRRRQERLPGDRGREAGDADEDHDADQGRGRRAGQLG